MKGPNPNLPNVTLPIMPRTARELQRLLGLASTRHQHLHEVLLTDPAAAIAVFRELGQTRPGASDRVGDAAHAVSLIGMDPFRDLIDSLPELQSDDDGKTRTSASAYSQAAHAAFYAGEICGCRNLGRLQEISTAALLQNPAVLALSVAEPESTLRASNAVCDGVSVEVAFGAELGEPLQDANRRLAEEWSLPALARQTMGDWNDFNKRLQAVKLADEIAKTTAISWHGEHTETITAVLSEFLDVSRDKASAWLHEKAIDAARTLSRFDYPLPGFQLLLMPGEVEDEDDDDEDIPLMGSMRSDPAAPQPSRAPDLHETMAQVMKRIREQAGASRVMFAMLNRDRSRLRTRLALGGREQDGIRRLDLELAQKHLFSALMTKPQSLWLNQENAAKYQAHLPPPLRQMLDPEGTFLMSLFVGDKPLGLMYSDGKALNEQGYRQFRALCQEATSVLTAGSHVAPPVPKTDSAQ